MKKNKKETKEIEINHKKIKLDSEKILDRERKIKVIKVGLLIILLFLIILYFILRVAYETGNFTITLDPNFSQKSGIVMYEKLAEKEDKRILKAERADFIDNISIKWLPENLNKEAEGSHNGDNYLAYSFYLENKGADVVNYWYQILIDDVIKNVDKAVRVIVYRNDEKTVYAKPNERTGEAEKETKKFYSEKEVMVEGRKDFKPGDIDKFTIVIFVEGDDPDCLDPLIGGEIKMHMEITEEHIKQN